jgi:hypothetical protein
LWGPQRLRRLGGRTRRLAFFRGVQIAERARELDSQLLGLVADAALAYAAERGSTGVTGAEAMCVAGSVHFLFFYILY